jgi:hypothetical protein
LNSLLLDRRRVGDEVEKIFSFLFQRRSIGTRVESWDFDTRGRMINKKPVKG